MALSSLTGYQIVLIVILAFNFLFWVSVIVWRAMSMGGIVTASRRYMRGMRSLLRSSATRHETQSRSSSINTAEGGCQANQPPPPYEEAIKYPSISSLLSTPHLSPVTSAVGQVNSAMDAQLVESSSSENENPSNVTTSANMCGLKKQLIRSFSCGDLESIPSPTTHDSPTPHHEMNHL